MAVPNGLGENGPRAAHLDVEVGKQVMQYQVRGHAPPAGPRPVLPALRPRGEGHRVGGLQLGPQGELPCPQNLPESPGAGLSAGQTQLGGAAQPLSVCGGLAAPPPGLERGGD